MVVTRDVMVDGRLAFALGEQLIVERVEANLERPRYKYVVYSQKLSMYFQLSDSDIAFPVLPVSAPAGGRNGRALILASVMAFLAVVSVIAVVALAGGGGSGTTSTNTGAVICLDAGHGGKDTGALENGVAEKDVNLDIALRARRILEDKGYRVVMTRDADTAVALAERCSIAQRSGARLLVSIHNNSRPPDVQGTTTYYFHGSPEGQKLATSVQSQVVARIHRPDRGLRESRLYMVRNVNMPSALLEGVFLSDAEEARLITDEGFRQQIAEGLAEGIDAYARNL